MRNIELGGTASPRSDGITVALLLIALVLLLIASVLILASVPPVDRDALTHHLAVPKLYLQHGGIFEIPWIVFSYYPMNLDLLYTLPLYFGNDIAPKFIHFGFALLTAVLVYRYLKEKIDTTYGLLGALAFLSIPVIVKLSVTVYVDLGLIFFSTAALLGLLRWADSGFRLRYLIVSAISCGLALGTKYNGLIVLFSTAMFVPLLYVRRDDRRPAPSMHRQLKSIGMTMLFVGVAVLVFSPWMIKNYIWTENPLYPLYGSFFNSRAHGTQVPAASVEKSLQEPDPADPVPEKSLSHFAQRKIVFGESGAEILAIPLRVFVQGRDDDPKYFDGKLNPALLLLPLIATFGWKTVSESQRRDEQVLLGFGMLYLLAVYVQIDMRIRWIAPIVPPLVILSMYGLRRLEIRVRDEANAISKGFLGAVFGGALLLLFGLNISYIVKQFDVIQPWDYIAGKVSRPEYIARYRREYPVIDYANRNLPNDARILAFYLGNRTYYSDRHLDCRYAIFFAALKNAQSSGDLFRILRREGISHLLIRLDMFDDYINASLGSVEQRTLAAFSKEHLRELNAANGYVLFSLFEQGGSLAAAGVKEPSSVQTTTGK
jgi:4-amino-4-deoxy-L-arabinose transferase-like glycosyltransferase